MIFLVTEILSIITHIAFIMVIDDDELDNEQYNQPSQSWYSTTIKLSALKSEIIILNVVNSITNFHSISN